MAGSFFTPSFYVTEAVTEIQVFDVELKEGSLDEDVLLSIDGAIPFPIIFQIKSSLCQLFLICKIFMNQLSKS